MENMVRMTFKSPNELIPLELHQTNHTTLHPHLLDLFRCHLFDIAVQFHVLIVKQQRYDQLENIGQLVYKPSLVYIHPFENIHHQHKHNITHLH